MIPILPETAWLEFRSRPKMVGQNQTTHQALVLDPSGREHKCFVKASPPNFPMAFSEGLGWLIAEALDLPRPKFAALLHLPIQRLGQHMRLDQHWMQYSHALAFCSSTVEGKHVTSTWRWLAKLRTAGAFKRADVARIAAFDTWVENQDRHMGNFIQTRAGDYIPIDNELILYSLVWASQGFNYQHNSLRSEAKQLLKAPGLAKFESAMVVAGHQHEQAFLKVSPTLQHYITTMIADPAHGLAAAQQIASFLGTRAQGGWLASELGRII
jgi:hypothetical protein